MPEERDPLDFDIDVDDTESDEEAAIRAAQALRTAALPPEMKGAFRRTDPTKAAAGSGRKVVYGPEFSDPEDLSRVPVDPSADPEDPSTKTRFRQQKDIYPGQIAPAAAGERSKVEQAQQSIRDFIQKYSKLAVDRFYGAKGGEIGVSGPKAGSALAAIQPRLGKRGGVKGMSQLMDKNRALKLVDDIPMAAQDEAIQMQKELAYYIWTIHANARPAFRQAVLKQLGLESNKPITVQKRDADGKIYYDQVKPSETDKFKKLLAGVSEQFDTDSTKVKAGINLISTATGMLKRAAGRSGAADAPILAKKPRFGKPPEIVAKPATTRLSPELAALAGPAPYGDVPGKKGALKPGVNPFTGEPTGLHEPAEPLATEPQQRMMVSPRRVTEPGEGVPIVSKFPRARHHPSRPGKPGGYFVRKKEPNEAIDRWVNEVIQLAVADYSPTWVDDL